MLPRTVVLLHFGHAAPKFLMKVRKPNAAVSPGLTFHAPPPAYHSLLFRSGLIILCSTSAHSNHRTESVIGQSVTRSSRLSASALATLRTADPPRPARWSRRAGVQGPGP